jgi:hypothetical protein
MRWRHLLDEFTDRRYRISTLFLEWTQFLFEREVLPARCLDGRAQIHNPDEV